MNFTQRDPQAPQSMMSTNTKGSTSEEINNGKKAIEKTSQKIAGRREVQAGIQAGKKGLEKAKKGVLSLFGMGDESPQQPQNQLGGKRRRKSRRKKRTKRRRKSRRKKRRTKRRRKSRRKRRR